jgi:8-oxo-dGTP pyrophosphatase MutT (NUDIX family)
MKQAGFNDFVQHLKNNLLLPLPGRGAQSKLEPPTRKNYPDENPPDARLGAVLALFFPDAGSTRLIFIQRTPSRGVHSGQISFPGGAYETEDQNMRNTAIRETNEEIGVPTGQINIIGKLSLLYIPPSNFLVHPFVGYVEEKPDFTPDPSEVNAVFSVSLDQLLHDECIQNMDTTVHDTRINVPCFYVGEKIIWGATAMILSELLEVIRQNK